MTRLFITYNLRKGVSREQYRRWSREVDQVIFSRFPAIRAYSVYEIEGAERGEPFCEIVEEIEVDSWDEWVRVNGYRDYPEMKDVMKEWLELCDPDSVQVLYGSKI